MDGIETEEDELIPYVEVQFYPDLDAVYFHIKSFHDSIIERDASVISDYIASVDEPINNIIIDITGNGGGSTEYWRKNIVSPFGGEYEYTEYIFFQDSPINQRMFFQSQAYSNFTFSTVDSLGTDVKIPHFCTEHEFTMCCPYTFTVSTNDYTGTKTDNNARRWVLVDEQVYSAADNFAVFCQDTGWATVVGKTTAGDGLGIDPSMILLKNTGLLVRFSTCTLANKENEMNALFGTVPDISCKPSESPLEACKRIIQLQE